MKLPVLIAIIVLSTLAIGGGLYYMNSNSQTSTTQTQNKANVANSQNQNTSGTESTVTGTITDLLETQDSKKCTWEGTVAQQSIKGTVYIGNEKFRSDVTSNAGTGAIAIPLNMTIVGDQKQAHAWMEVMGQKIAYVMDLEKLKNQSNTTNLENMQAYEQFNQDYNFDCSSWNVDESMFVIPSNIEFKTL